MDADMMAVYRRLADRWPVSYSFRHVAKFNPDASLKLIRRDTAFPDLCTAEMTTFLKETNTNGSTA